MYDALAEIYDQQYERYRDDVPFYLRLADDYGGPILELGAGTARLSAALARAGHQVVALEPSQGMMERGRERLERDGLQERVRYHQGDMRTVRLNERFPLILAPLGTLSHAYTLQDQDATLATVKAHLEPGGLFAFDVQNPNFNELNVLRREAEWEHVGGEHSELFLHQHLDEDAQILETRFYLDSTEPDGTLKRRTMTLKQRYYNPFELERALRHAGFEQLTFYGDFDKRRYQKRAPNLVCLAK